MKKILLMPFAALLLSCGYDYPENYNGWQVVGNGELITNLTLKKGKQYNNVLFPRYFIEKYELGDTIGRLTAAEKNDMNYSSWRSQILKEYSDEVNTNQALKK